MSEENKFTEECSADELEVDNEAPSPAPTAADGPPQNQEEAAEDTVLKPKKVRKRSAGQDEGLKKAQEARKKMVELNKAEKLVAAEKLLRERDAQVRPSEEKPKKESDSFKQLKELVEILDLSKTARRPTTKSDSDTECEDEEIRKMEKVIARKKAIRKVLRDERLRNEPKIDRNTVNNAHKNMLSFSYRFFNF